jgi:hypothetical protein
MHFICFIRHHEAERQYEQYQSQQESRFEYLHEYDKHQNECPSESNEGREYEEEEVTVIRSSSLRKWIEDVEGSVKNLGGQILRELSYGTRFKVEGQREN